MDRGLRTFIRICIAAVLVLLAIHGTAGTAVAVDVSSPENDGSPAGQCPAGSLHLSSNGNACCAPIVCPAGSVRGCTAAGEGECICAPGYIPADTQPESRPVVGTSGDTQCVPLCEDADAVDCTSGQCKCLTCPGDQTVVVRNHQVECANECPYDIDLRLVTASEACDYDFSDNGDGTFARSAECDAAIAEADGQNVFSGSVPQCLIDDIAAANCPTFDGTIQTRLRLPEQCREPMDREYHSLMALWREMDSLYREFVEARRQREALTPFTPEYWAALAHETTLFHAQNAARATYQAADGIYAQHYAFCQPFYVSFPVDGDDCAILAMYAQLVRGDPPLPYPESISGYRDFNLKEAFGVTSFTVLLNDQCEVVPRSDAAYCTGSAESVWSPISLELGTKKVDDIVSASTFPLVPGDKRKWFWWRGSEETPLLVFDPENKGTVEGPEQLFGNFTFGKTFADGFAALATLDSDGDGVLRGSEIEKIKLWMDANSDGVAKPGEVKKLSDLGITALFYKNPARPNALTLKLDIGFERTVNGKTTTGAAVDWFSPSFAARDEAILELTKLRTAMKGKKTSSTELAARRLDPPPPPPSSPQDLVALAGENSRLGRAQSMTGFWQWKMDATKPGSAVPSGILTVLEKDGLLTGHSIVEMALASGQRQVKGVPLKGRILGAAPDGGTRFEFEIRMDSGEVTKTTGTLSDNRKVLTAQSITTIPSSKGAKPATMTYRWQATRVKGRES